MCYDFIIMWMVKFLSYFSLMWVLISNYTSKNKLISDVYLSQKNPNLYQKLRTFYTNMYKYSLYFIIIHTLFLTVLYFNKFLNNKIILFIGIFYFFCVSIIGILLTYSYSQNYDALKEYQQYKLEK